MWNWKTVRNNKKMKKERKNKKKISKIADKVRKSLNLTNSLFKNGTCS